jgi:hypothetical protein
MATGARQLLITVPSGSGVFRVIDIPGAQYQTGYVSTSPGSFKGLGESGNWYGSPIKTCFAEVEPTGTPVYEATRFRQNTPFLSAFNLPNEIQQALYDDRDLPAGSYSKSHIVLELAQQYLPSGSYSGVFFPSRRDPDGGVLTYDPHKVSVEFTYTGIKPPPPELFR